jgi:hypothetical protein
MTDPVSAKSFFDTHPWLLKILLAVCFAGALAIRIFNITAFPLDFHPDRQEQSMLKARGMYYQTLTDVPEWQKQMAIMQWHSQPIQEPEIMEHLAAFSYQVAGAVELWIPRLYSIIFWLIGAVALFLLIRDLVGSDGALIGTIFFLFSYFGVIASRSFQPDPLMVMFIILGLWALYRWSRSPTWLWTVAAGLLCGLAIYVKAPALIFIAGGIAGLLLGDRGLKNSLRDPRVWVLGSLTLLPAVIYHVLGTYILKFLGTNYYDARIYPDLLKDPYYYMQWINRIDQVVSFPIFLAAFIGIFLIASRKGRALAMGVWVGYFLYGAVFLYYMAGHDYYNLPLYPIVAIGLGAAAQVVIDRLRMVWKHEIIKAVVILVVLVWAGQQTYAARASLRSDNFSSQVAMYEQIGSEVRDYHVVGIVDDYSMRMQYYGWAMVSYWPNTGDFDKSALSGGTVDLNSLFQEMTAGQDLFLVTDLGELDQQADLKEILYNHYTVFDKGEGYIIFDLRKPIS